MICKFCKNEIPDTSLSCPVCGKTLYEVRQRPMPEVEEEPVSRSPLDFLPIIAGVLAIVAIVISIVATVSVRKNAGLQSENLNNEIARLEQRISVLEFKLKDMGEKPAAPQNQTGNPNAPAVPSPNPNTNTQGQLPAPTSSPDANAKKLTVLANPTGEEREVGYKSMDGRYLFGFVVEGDLEGFKWEKKQANGSWAQISFDENGFSKQYGISVLTDLEGGSTKLVASGLTADSAGEYRCTAFGKAGDKVEANVTLKINQPETQKPQNNGNNQGNTGNQGNVQPPQDFDDETMDGFMG